MYFNSKGKDEVTYDAIVIGSGISGGWAVKELTEKGLKVLCLERGRMLKHGDYPTANLESWEVPNRGRFSQEELEDYNVQRRTGYTINHYTKHLWPKDSEHPYTETKPFDWIRGYHLGGRSIMWGKHCYRFSDTNFEENLKEGVAIDWPIRYNDIKPWYDYVETFAGISGQKENSKSTPNGIYQPPFELNCVEQVARDAVMKAFNGARIISPGRVAHITKQGGHNGRGTCLTRNRCIRGCPFGAYFSSNAATIPPAEATGNLTIRPHSIAHSIIFDDETQLATGVNVIDAETKESHEFFAKIIFCNASALHSAAILMNSKSDRFPDGMGNDSGELGHNVMDHHFKAGATGFYEGFEDRYYKGRKPAGIFIPRFRNIDGPNKMKDFTRGYGFQGGASRLGWNRPAEAMMGEALKDELSNPGQWRMNLLAFGECLPYHDNKMTLRYDKLDKYGIPTLDLDVEWKENEYAMRKDMPVTAAEMLDAAGFKNIQMYDNVEKSNPGNGIHEMGTARMGRDPKTSVLNKWNQIHAVKNVFVTDGACMTSAANQNPSITYMALTARAADYAVKELNKGNLS